MNKIGFHFSSRKLYYWVRVSAFINYVKAVMGQEVDSDTFRQDFRDVGSQTAELGVLSAQLCIWSVKDELLSKYKRP